MAKGLIGGMTNYNHQSFSAIIEDLERERKSTLQLKDNIKNNIDILIANHYWNNNVPIDFRSIINFSLTHFTTAIAEFRNLTKDLKNEVKEHHIDRLIMIAEVSHEINEKIGRIWHEDYINKEYGNANFEKVETIYQDTRDLAVNLLDTQNIANKLTALIGYRSRKPFPYIKVVGTLAALATIIILFFGDNLLGRFFSKEEKPGTRSINLNHTSSDTSIITKDLQVPAEKDNPSAENSSNRTQQTFTPKKEAINEKTNINDGINYGSVGGNNNQNHVIQGDNYGVNGNLYINEIRDLNDEDKRNLLTEIERYYQDTGYQGEKCFSIFIVQGSNGSKTAKQIEDFLRSQDFRLSGTGIKGGRYIEGVEIGGVDPDGCVIITVGNI